MSGKANASLIYDRILFVRAVALEDEESWVEPLRYVRVGEIRLSRRGLAAARRDPPAVDRDGGWESDTMRTLPEKDRKAIINALPIINLVFGKVGIHHP